MISKQFSREKIISMFHDGQVIMTGGFGFHGVPFELLKCLEESGARHLTNIALDASCSRLYHKGIFDKVIIAHGGSFRPNLELLASGKIEVEYCPMGTIAERMRAGGAGLGGILVKTGLGTVVEEGKEKIVVDGETYLLEKPLTADISLVKAYTADAYGNLTYRGVQRNSNPLVAAAGDVTIVEVERFASLGEIAPDAIHTTGVQVDMILDTPITERNYSMEYLLGMED